MSEWWKRKWSMRTSEQVWQLRITDRIPPVLTAVAIPLWTTWMRIWQTYPCCTDFLSCAYVLAFIYYPRLQGLAVKHCRHTSEARAHGDQWSLTIFPQFYQYSWTNSCKVKQTNRTERGTFVMRQQITVKSTLEKQGLWDYGNMSSCCLGPGTT